MSQTDTWCWYVDGWERYRVVDMDDVFVGRELAIEEAVEHFVETGTPIESIVKVMIRRCQKVDPMNYVDKFDWFKDRFEENVYDESGCDSTDDVIEFSDGAKEAYQQMMREFLQKYVSLSWWSCEEFKAEDVTEEVRKLVQAERAESDDL